MRIIEIPIAFIIGGASYVFIELMWRGRSDISMAIAGGLSFLILHLLFTKYTLNIWQRCIVGALIITAIEFVAGYIVNIRMKRNVWDYSSLKLNLYGQICLRYSLLWAALTIPISWLSKALRTLTDHIVG